MSVAQEVAIVKMGKPHVVILGAGASKVNCPTGDKNGKKLPLMNDFSETLGLSKQLQDWGFDPDISALTKCSQYSVCVLVFLIVSYAPRRKGLNINTIR